MKTNFFIATITAYSILFTANSFSQGVAVNTTGATADSSALFDVSSADKGVLIPRINESQKNSITRPATSLMIYQTDGVSGYYFNAGTPSSPSWTLLRADNLGNHTAADSLNMSNNKIYNLATCTNNLDAANKEYVDSKVGAGGGGGGTLADTTFQYSGTKILEVSYGGTSFTVPDDRSWSIESAICNSGYVYPVRISYINGNAVSGASIGNYSYSGNNIYCIATPYIVPPGTVIIFNVGNTGTHKGWVSIKEYKRVVQ